MPRLRLPDCRKSGSVAPIDQNETGKTLALILDHGQRSRISRNVSSRTAHRRSRRLASPERGSQRRVPQAERLRVRSVSHQPEGLGGGGRQVLQRRRSRTRTTGRCRDRNIARCLHPDRPAVHGPRCPPRVVPSLLWERERFRGGRARVRRARHRVHRRGLPAHVLRSGRFRTQVHEVVASAARPRSKVSVAQHDANPDLDAAP